MIVWIVKLIWVFLIIGFVYVIGVSVNFLFSDSNLI